MLLRHRRLLSLSLFAILSVFIAEALPHEAKPYVFWLLPIPILLCFFISLRKRRAIALTLALLLAFAAFFSSYQVSYKREIALKVAEEEEILASATVLSPTGKTEDLFTAEGRMTLVHDGASVSFSVKILSPISLQPGDLLYGDALFRANEDGSFDAKQGFYGTLSFGEDCMCVAKLEEPVYALGELRAFLIARLNAAVPDGGGALLCALLLGFRDGLRDDFTRDMERIGTTHMLSLSGMHLAVLTMGIAFLLKRLRLGRALRTLLLSGFVIFFMLLTGLTPSVMRAGFMFLFSALPFFLREERDALSSLAAAVAVICLFEPYAATDLSLWLSALSTLGILLFFDRVDRNPRTYVSPLRRICRVFAISFAVSLSATVATLPLTLCFFGTLPLLSPLANLLLSPLVQVALYLSLFVTAFGNFPVFTWISTHLCNLIFTIADVLADVPHTVLSFKGSPALPVIFVGFGVLLLYFLFAPRKRFRLAVPVSILLCCAVTVGAIEGGTHLAHRNELTVTYYTDAEMGSDALLFRYKEERLLTVFSQFKGVGKAERAALENTAGEVDAFLLPYYTSASVDYVNTLLNDYKLYRLYLPTPEFDAEWEIYHEILKAAAKESVPTVAFPKNGAFRFAFLTVSRLVPKYEGEAPRAAFAEFLFGYTHIGYYSTGILGTALQGEAFDDALLILGTFGLSQNDLLAREEYVGENAQFLCALPEFFPFADASGVVFREVGICRLPMRTETS